MWLADVQVSWDGQTPLMMGTLILGSIFVIAAVFGQNPIGHSPSRQTRNRLVQTSFDPAPAGGKANPFKNPRERRAALRRDGSPVWIIVADNGSPSDQAIATVIDRSTGGLCLSMPHEAIVGRFLNVRAVNAPASFPWVNVEVRHCRQRKDRWITGCRFEQRLSWSELHSFG